MRPLPQCSIPGAGHITKDTIIPELALRVSHGERAVVPEAKFKHSVAMKVQELLGGAMELCGVFCGATEYHGAARVPCLSQ